MPFRRWKRLSLIHIFIASVIASSLASRVKTQARQASQKAYYTEPVSYTHLVIPGTAFGPAGEGFVRMALRADIPRLKVLFDSMAHDEEWLCAAARRA